MYKLLIFFAAVTILGSCSQDTYRSEPPRFSDISVKKLSGTGAIHVGDRVVISLVETSKGKLLNTTTYSWSFNPSAGVRNQKYMQGTIYDKNTSVPVDTVTVTAAGSISVTFVGKYSVSGNEVIKGYKLDFPNNGSVYCTSSPLLYQITATKSFNILP